MTIIHDKIRNQAMTHEIFGAAYKFEPNDKGDFVCDVADEKAIECFLSITECFCAYGPQAEEEISKLLTENSKIDADADEEVATLPPRADSYVLVSGDTSFDLTTLNDSELRAFATANGIKIHRAAKGDTIRDRIVAALKTEA